MPSQAEQLIGADPEFVFAKDGCFQPANRVFRGNSVNKPLGTDGHVTTAEVRPSPGTPQQVFTNIRRLLTDAVRYKCKAYAGSEVFGEALGGHIHFSKNGWEANTNNIISLLDRFIAKPLNGISRYERRGEYQRLGQWREQPHGFEYRSCCSWLAHPELTEGALTIAYILAYKAEGQQLKTVKELQELATDEEKGVIDRFYQRIERIRYEEGELEQVEIFQAWEIEGGNGGRVKRPTGVKVTFSIDEFMQEIKQIVKKMIALRTQEGLRFVGARKDREGKRVVFVNENLRGILVHRDARWYRFFTRIEFVDWLPNNTIALSYNLREQTALAAQVVRFIISKVQREERS